VMMTKNSFARRDGKAKSTGDGTLSAPIAVCSVRMEERVPSLQIKMPKPVFVTKTGREYFVIKELLGSTAMLGATRTKEREWMEVANAMRAGRAGYTTGKGMNAR
jgi:hypothetical protein